MSDAIVSEYDLIVCGGGLVGASLVSALLPSLKQTKLRIALIEQSEIGDVPDPSFQPSFDARSTALARGSRTAFERMGVWMQLAQHVEPIDHIQVSDRGQLGQVNMRAEDEQVDALGYVVENHWVGQVLMHNIQTQSEDQVQLISPASVESIIPTENGQQVSVTLSSGERRSLSASLVVMADGGRSELRKRMGIDYQEQDYHQHALIANIALDRPHGGVAYERFTESGPIALLPIETLDRQARMGLVWTLPEDEIDEKRQLSDREFLAQLQQAFGYRAGAFLSVGARYSYPLKLILADEQVRSGLVVLGNAAHSLHPIAGQGFNLALRGVCELAQLIIDRKVEGLDLGDLEALDQFLENRRQDQQRTIGFGDTALKLFTQTNPAARLARSAGLQLLDAIPAARTLLARAAMGMDIPAVGLKPHD